MGSIYDLLSAVPKAEIIRRFLEIVNESRLLDVAEGIDKEISSINELRKAPHSTVVQVAKALSEFTEQDVRDLYEEYRYRGTKTLYICLYPPHHQEDLPNLLRENAEDISRRLMDNVNIEGVSSLQIRDVTRFNVEQDFIWEVVYSYVAYLQAIDPDTERNVHCPDMRYGFLWLNLTTPWIVISAPDEKVVRTFEQALMKTLGIIINRMPIPEEAERVVESYENIRRATHIDGRGIKRRVYHQSLYEFDDVLQEVQSLDHAQSRWNSGYNATIGDIRFVINYSREKGAFSFSKLLPTSLLREFVVHKVNDLYEAVQNIISSTPNQIISLNVDHHLRGYRSQTRQNIRTVLEALATARMQSQSEAPIPNTVDLAKMKKFFRLSVESECSVCGEISHLHCEQCGSERIALEEQGLRCERCGAINALACEHGHIVNVLNPHEAVFLYPTHLLLDVAERIFAALGNIPTFNRYEEGFFIHNDTLRVFGAHGEKVVYLADEIPEFRDLPSLSSDEAENLYQILREYKEKCKEANDQNCQICVSQRIGEKCFLRLFGLYTDRYTPRPHGGSEFGDVSFDVTINGHLNQRLVILLKKGNPKGRPITLRHSIGRDIYTQIESLWNRPEIAILGIGVPQRFSEDFISRIQMRARESGKKVLFLDQETLAKIVKYVMDTRHLDPEDL